MRFKFSDKLLLTICCSILFLAHCKLNSQKDNRARSNPAIEPSPSSIGGGGNRLTVARIDAGQKTTQVHQVDMGQAFQKDTVLKELTLTPGCTQTIAFSKTLQTVANDTKIKKITMRGFANGDSNLISDGRYNVSFNTFQGDAAAWDWTFATADGTSSVTKVKQPGWLDEIYLQVDGKSAATDEKAYIWQADLIKLPDPILFKDSSDIKVTWKTRNLGDLSYVRVFLRGKSKTFACTFATTSSSGSVDTATLKALDGNEIQLSAEAESHSYYAAQGLLVSSYDWRQGLLVRQ